MLELVKFAEIVLRHQEEGQCWGGGSCEKIPKEIFIKA